MSEEDINKMKTCSSSQYKKKKRKKRKKVKPPEAVHLSLVPACMRPQGQTCKLQVTCEKTKDQPSLDNPPKELDLSRRDDAMTACVAELSIQVTESLRWEGALQDPQAEEERLEVYRANRRRRYVAQREMLAVTSPHLSQDRL